MVLSPVQASSCGVLRLVPPKQICVGMKSQDPMAICFTNRTKGAPTLVEYSQHGLTMRFSQASRQNFKVLSDVSVMAE
nr:acyl-coenzyme A synthetase ACSM6, mitochondrial-like isoform X3 [Equus asinus]